MEKLSTKKLEGKRIIIDGKPVLIVPEGSSGLKQTWRPKDIFFLDKPQTTR